MWSSIENVVLPETLEQAVVLAAKTGHGLVAGGSYLAARRPREIDTLVFLRDLLDNSIREENETLSIGAGATLQEIIDAIDGGPFASLIESIRYSCPSRLVRNQRTLGGEVAMRRANSELAAALLALDASLVLMRGEQTTEPLREWDGTGVIVAVEFMAAQIHLQRFSLLPSAPPFVIVTTVKRARGLDVVVGGDTPVLKYFVLPSSPAPGQYERLAEEASRGFVASEIGSLEYKRDVIRVALRRAGEDQ